MARLIYFLMILMMVVWTALLAVDLAQGLPGLADAAEAPAQEAEQVARRMLGSLWTQAAQARAIVWGIPMLVFAMIAALAQR